MMLTKHIQTRTSLEKLTSSSSALLINITMERQFSCQIILQKSFVVSSKGYCVAMKACDFQKPYRKERKKKEKKKIIASEHWFWKNTVAIGTHRKTLRKSSSSHFGERRMPSTQRHDGLRGVCDLDSRACPPHFVCTRAYFAGSFSARRNRILRAAKTASNTKTTKHNPGLRFQRTLRCPLPQVTGPQQQKTWTLPEGNLHWYNLILLPLDEGRVPLSHYQLKKMNTAKSAKLDIVLMMNKYVSVTSSLLRWLQSGDDRTVSGRFVPSKRSYFAPNRKFV